VNIIDGKAIAAQIKQDLKSQARGACLAVVIVGDDPASHVYVRAKIKAATEVGIATKLHELPANTTESNLIALIEKLGIDNSVHGILVQLPLPAHLDTRRVLDTIPPAKDVDGLHTMNSGRLFQDADVPYIKSCTPLGVMELLRSLQTSLVGRHAVVVGRSNLVGKPMAMMLLNAGCTVTITHKQTVDLASHTRMADILVVAAGCQNLITADMVKIGAVVIDVGINRTADGKLCGDVDFENVSKIASHITPVPGGVGPMTIAMVLQNTINATLNQLSFNPNK